MVNDFKYNVENHQIFFTGKENPFRTLSPQAKDVFAAGITVYPLPIKLTRIPRFYQKTKKVRSQIAGIADFGYLAHHGYEDLIITLSGDMLDFSMMHFLTSACTTTDNTPVGFYTHVYATTTAKATSPPTFQMVYKMINDEEANANDIWILFTGCILKKASIKSAVNSTITCELEIHAANATVGATALTTEANTTIMRTFQADDAVVTFTKATAAVPGKIIEWEIIYDAGHFLSKAQGESKPEEALNGLRDIHLKLKWVPQYEPDGIVNDDLPETDDDLDCTIKISRNTTNDYVEFAFQKLWNSLAEDGAWDFNDYYFSQGLDLVIKPTAYEAGGVLTITEVNLLDDDRYET